jgi:hypothetical protein
MQVLFTESKALSSFLTAMGIAKSSQDFNLTNIFQENPNRLFKTSKINSMMSHTSIGVYNCDNNPQKPKYTMRVYHNAFLQSLDLCAGAANCNVDTFLNSVQAYQRSCVSSRTACAV